MGRQWPLPGNDPSPDMKVK